MKLFAVALSLLLGLTGCPQGGDTTGSSASDGSSSAPGSQTPCPAHTSWELRCFGQDGGSSDAWGQTECPKFPWELVQPAFVNAMTSCLRTLSCDRTDDTCTDAALEAIGIDAQGSIPSALQGPYQHCLDRAHNCGVLDDNCLQVIAFTDEGRTLIDQCIDQSCQTLGTCLTDPRSP